MRTLEILERLIGFDTVSAKSNLELIYYAEALLKDVGYRVTRISSPTGKKSGLYAEIGPQVAGGLLLSAHSDVVPADGQIWERPAFKLTTDTERLYGRGTTDMKGFLACALATAVAADPAKLKRLLALVVSYDEEIGCVGIAEMEQRLAPLLRSPSLCIVGEPTEMQVAVGHKGKRAYRAEFHGEAGHSALAPRFQNALHVAADFMNKLRDLQAELRDEGPQDPFYDIAYATVHVGTLHGGTALNLVPEIAEMNFEIRHLGAQEPKDLDHRVEQIAQAFGDLNGQRRVVTKISGSYAGLDTASSQESVAKLIERTGAGFSKVPFGTEAGTFDRLGIPTVVCGPGSMEGQGHKPDEYIEWEQIARCEKLLNDLVFDLAE